jgi:hypothetical protein
LLLHRSLVLPQDFRPATLFDFAALHIEQEFHFPGLECGSHNNAAENFTDQPVEPVEHDFQLYQVVRRHVLLIGRFSMNV